MSVRIQDANRNPDRERLAAVRRRVRLLRHRASGGGALRRRRPLRQRRPGHFSPCGAVDGGRVAARPASCCAASRCAASTSNWARRHGSTPSSSADSEKLSTALGKMIAEDPSFRVEVDQESGETILKGMGELHLDIKVDILRRTHKVDVEMGKPQVAYRETITAKAEGHHRHKKQTGGSGQFAQCTITMEANPGNGYEFIDKIFGGSIPDASMRLDALPVDFSGRRVAVQIDGGRVRLRENKGQKKHAKRKKGSRPKFDTPWREPKALIIFEFNEQGKMVKKERQPLIDGTTDLVKDTQSLTTKAAGTLSNCNTVLADLSGLLAARRTPHAVPAFRTIPSSVLESVQGAGPAVLEVQPSPPAAFAQGDSPPWRGRRRPTLGPQQRVELTPHLGERDFDTALFADHTTVFEAFVFTAQTFIVLDRSKYLGAEQAVTFRLEGAIIDGLWFLHFSVGPGMNKVGRGQPDANRIEIVTVTLRL